PRLLLRPTNWQGRTVKVDAEPVTIGRHPDNVLCLHDEKLSRFHCIVEPDGNGGFRIRDLGSRNGTRVNETKVDEVPVGHGDVLRLGAHEFVIEFVADPAPVAEPRRRGRESTPAATRAAPDGAWIAELERLLNTLPPKDKREEPVTMIEAN